MKIAIVDDIAAERTLLNDRLSRQLHGRNIQTDILEFNSGEEFLNAAKETPFTAVFRMRMILYLWIFIWME